MVQFVAIASGGAVGATSPDGATWTGRTLPASSSWSAIAYNNSIYCAVGNGTSAATSPDGITWTLQTLPTSATWTGIAWNGSVFCAVANAGTVAATSPDGVTWTLRTLPASATWIAIAWNGSVFCAISQGSTSAATSPDGVTWTLRTLPSASSWTAIAWNNSVFCAIATAGTVAATSPDGITWTAQTLPVSGGWYAIAWNGSVFCATGNGTTAATSPDGITWTTRTMPSSVYWSGIAWNGSVFCAVAGIVSSNVAATSPDGITWTGRTLPSSGLWSAIVGINLDYRSFGTSSATLEAITAAGVVFSGNVSYATLQAPMATSTALTGNIGSSAVTLQPPTGTGAGVIWNNGAMVKTMQYRTKSMAAHEQLPKSMELFVKSMSAVSGVAATMNKRMGVIGSAGALTFLKSMTTSVEGSMSKQRLNLRKSTIAATGAIVSINRAMTLWQKSSSAGVSGFGSMSKTLMLFGKSGIALIAEGSTWSTFSMHAERQALTQYLNYKFNSFCIFNGKVYGASTTGLSELTGASDNGTVIVGLAAGGISDFGDNHLKTVDRVHMGYRTNGEIQFSIIQHDDGTQYDYPLPSSGAAGIFRRRVITGRGLRAQYFQWKVGNINGASMSIDSIDISVTPLSRRIGGLDA